MDASKYAERALLMPMVAPAALHPLDFRVFTVLGEIAMRFQFSIRWLLAAVVYVAVASAIFSNPTPLSAAVASGLTLPLLCYAPVVAVMLGGERRAFWAGVAISTAFYCCFVHFGSRDVAIAFHLLGERLGYEKYFRGYAYDVIGNPDVNSFASSALNLLTWPIALIGGILARHLYNSQRKSE